MCGQYISIQYVSKFKKIIFMYFTPVKKEKDDTIENIHYYLTKINLFITVFKTLTYLFKTSTYIRIINLSIKYYPVLHVLLHHNLVSNAINPQ